MNQMHLISDGIARICNAQIVTHSSVILKYSKFVYNILQVLLQEGYVLSINNIEINNKAYIRVILKYDKQYKPVIKKIYMVSKPSKRIYKKRRNINFMCNNLSILILSTSYGVMSNFKAKKLGIGGEIICAVF